METVELRFNYDLNENSKTKKVRVNFNIVECFPDGTKNFIMCEYLNKFAHPQANALNAARHAEEILKENSEGAKNWYKEQVESGMPMG